MKPEVFTKEIPSKHLDLIQKDGTLIIGDEGKVYAPQTWLVRHILSIMQELEFDYNAALRTSQILSEVLQQSPIRLPIRDFLESAGAEEQLKTLTMTDDQLALLGFMSVSVTSEGRESESSEN